MYSNVEFEGIDHKDHPKYTDAFIVSADKDGKPMTEQEIEEIESTVFYELLYNFLY